MTNIFAADGFWIGGFKNSLGRWMWETRTSETPIISTDWTPGQPDNLYNGQKCLSLFYKAISPNLQWGDGRCEVLVNYICERDVTSFGISGLVFGK